VALHAAFLVLSVTAVSSIVQQHETRCVQEILMNYRKKIKKKEREKDNERRYAREGEKMK